MDRGTSCHGPCPVSAPQYAFRAGSTGYFYEHERPVTVTSGLGPPGGDSDAEQPALVTVRGGRLAFLRRERERAAGLADVFRLFSPFEALLLRTGRGHHLFAPIVRPSSRADSAASPSARGVWLLNGLWSAGPSRKLTDPGLTTIPTVESQIPFCIICPRCRGTGGEQESTRCPERRVTTSSVGGQYTRERLPAFVNEAGAAAGIPMGSSPRREVFLRSSNRMLEDGVAKDRGALGTLTGSRFAPGALCGCRRTTGVRWRRGRKNFTETGPR